MTFDVDVFEDVDERGCGFYFYWYITNFFRFSSLKRTVFNGLIDDVENCMC